MLKIKKECTAKAASALEEKNDKFRDALSIVVEQVLIGTLGERGAQAIYVHLQQDYQLKKEMMHENLETFHKGLMETIGPGATLIEKCVAEKMYACLFHGDKDLSINKKGQNFDFHGYMQNLKKTYITASER